MTLLSIETSPCKYLYVSKLHKRHFLCSKNKVCFNFQTQENQHFLPKKAAKISVHDNVGFDMMTLSLKCFRIPKYQNISKYFFAQIEKN